MQTEQAVTCKYPGCENEPRAADDGAGAKPKYCGRPDPLTRKPDTALTAFRRRQEPTRPGGAAEAEDLGRPVTMATARAAELRNGIRADMAALTGKLTDLAAQLDRAADPEAAAAQVEAVQAEAAQQVADAQAETAREAQRRQQAEADAEEARSAAVEMDGKLQAAETARGQAEQRAADACTDAEQARSEAAAQIEQTRAEAGTQVSAARDRAARAEAQAREAIERAHADAAALVRVAEEARDHAARELTQLRADADRAREEAARQLSRARADAGRERDELRTVLDARAATLAEARDDLRARAQRAEADLDQARAELAQLRQDSGSNEGNSAPGRGGAARLRRAKPGRRTQVWHSATRDRKDPGHSWPGSFHIPPTPERSSAQTAVGNERDTPRSQVEAVNDQQVRRHLACTR